VLIIWERWREIWPFTAMEGARGDKFCNKPMGVESCKLNIWPFLRATISRSFEKKCDISRVSFLFGKCVAGSEDLHARGLWY